MIRSLVIASSLSLAIAGPALAAPIEFNFDPGHTQVEFSYSHFGYSNITGRFDTVEGSLVYDAENPSASSAKATIDINSLSVGGAKIDAHLKSADFFNAEQFPKATFTSTQVEAAGEGKLRMSGDLSIHGVTRAVTLDVTINKVDAPPVKKAGFDAHVTIKRTDFGIDKYAPNVSDEVRIDITVEAKVATAE
jgi:polyisoprenoid-binding protein YceI